MKRTSQKLVKKKTSQSLKPVKHREDVKHIKSDAVQTTTQESRIVRVFFSSPFRGLEMEREELAKTYWPRLSSMCSKAGYEFVPVDLRWGITSEKMSNAGTVEVCLREIDRSDLFVGFYGQRYGWNGAKDEHLQRNLDVAAIKYPWVNQYRDRSVTEIEFLHGFLNEPGKRTSCFFFRAKAYDEKMVNIHKSTGNTDEVSKYTDEPNATALLKSLKTQIKAVKEKCCDLVDEYSDPQTGALLMFKAIKKYLEETILAEPAKETSDIQKESLLHEAYYISRLGVGTRRQYVGGERYLKDVDQHVISNVKGFRGKPLLILGDAGFGKTALIANWLHRHKQKYPDDLIAYHFVGCTPKSTSEKDILARLVLQLTLGFNEKFDEVQQVKAQPMKSSLSDGGLHGKLMKLRTRETYDIYRELKDIIAKISENGRRAIIIIDSLNRMDPIHQTKQELYWIPMELPKGVSLIVSTLKNDTTRIKVWTEDRQWDTLEVSSLSSDERHTIIKEMLAMRGKELTPTQVKMVVKKEQTSNALYLEILLKELCNFGDFRKLNDYLNFLLEVKSTKGLFTKVIERLESDFNPPKSKENKVCKVLCSILVSRYGLSDQEIKEITGIPDQLWSAIFFAMEDFFIIRAGLYDFSYDELADAIREKYCQDEEVQRGYISTIAYYYQRKLNELGLQHVIGGKTILRIADELPPLLKQLGYKEKLKHVITNLSIFTSIFSRPDTMYDLYGYLNFTNASGMEISSLFMKSLDKQSDFLKDKKKRTADADTAIATVRDLLAVAYDIAEVMCESGHPHDAVSVLQWAIKLQCYHVNSNGNINNQKKDDLQIYLHSNRI
ncbi:TPR repeat-containing protein DDB_G0287407-like [Glandiceps talaboti]